MTKAQATREEWRAMIENAPSRKSASGVSTVETIRSMSGLDFLRAIAAGRLPHPPINDTLDFFLVEATKGHAVFMGEAKHGFYNPIGSVHGGWACTLLDSCMACAAQTTLPVGQGYTTVELKVNLVRPLSSETGPVRAEGRVVSAGRTLVTAEGRIVASDGKLYAHGTTTCLVLGL
ncbi:MAG TPA: PaaI family thioesterase [Burkholderiales bacterium]|jgi:uncharacterized protein (TIGR00369 family)|nr:PaaI family thioesterase [Burkholderiales bacterium]